MIAFWIGIAFLATSWLWGVELLSPRSGPLWLGAVGAGVVLIASGMRRPPHSLDAELLPSRLRWVILIALLPVALLSPWPYRMPAIVLALGVGLTLTGMKSSWLARFSGAAILSGVVLFAQVVVLMAYTSWTARSHELPWPLPQLLAGLARFFGAQSASDGLNVVLPTMRANHSLGATWELFMDPASFAFIVAALVVVAVSDRGAPAVAQSKEKASSKSKPANTATLASTAIGKFVAHPAVRSAGMVLLAAALWLPFRSGLMMGVYLHRAIRTDYDSPLNVMNQFWSPWPHLLLLLPLALLLARWIRPLASGVPAVPGEPRLGGDASPYPAMIPAAIAFGVVALLTLAACWDPVGDRKPGRMAFDEYHSKWEPTTRPFDTEWYGHLSGYNYACIYDYASRFYDVSRITNAITDATLANLDVLVLKVPTEPFGGAEIDAVLRYVRNGGGLLLVGEHTDVFNTGYYLNTVARRLGFSFRYDCLFGLRSFFDQYYKPFFVSHPAVKNIRGLDFATSCSIDTGKSRGRGAIISGGLKNSMADYHANNYYPQAVDHAAMRYGAFVQLWGVRHGKGRVLAFTDSTIFSNFSAFEPGKPELLLGMIEWLNYRDAIGSPRFVLSCLAVLLFAYGVVRFRRRPVPLLLLVAAGALGWVMTAMALAISNDKQMPVPGAVRPYTRIVIDRTACDGPLSKNGFITGSTNGFGIFERWILRLGYFTERAGGAEALSGDATVFLYPTKSVDADYKKRLLQYVENGGKVLIVDSPKNVGSSAAELLQLFGLSAEPIAGQGGVLSVPAGWPAVPVEAAHEISGGKPLIHLDGKPVAASAQRGKGSVVVVGFGSRFSDVNMGVTGDVEPNEDLRKVFDLQFTLLRAMVQNTLP
jgi:hypothetical protein